MSTKKISDVEAFKRDSDEARKIRPTEEQIKKIRESIREAEIEEMENDQDAPAARSNTGENSSVQI